MKKKANNSKLEGKVDITTDATKNMGLLYSLQK